jgi:hypothetical protein
MFATPNLDLPFGRSRSRLYRQFFTPEEIRRLDAAPPESALSDIYLLRHLLRRLLASASKLKLTFKQRLAMLAALCQAALTLASLVRIHYKQQPEPLGPPELLALAVSDETEL